MHAKMIYAGTITVIGIPVNCGYGSTPGTSCYTGNTPGETCSIGNSPLYQTCHTGFIPDID
jgi:hypothetical protein